MTDAEPDDDALADAYNGALEREKAGDLAAAADLYRKALALDPADHGGAAVRLASIGYGDVPEKAPDAYVMTLFDQHAEVFDSVLVDQLGYSVPMMLGEVLPALLPDGAARLLDLGCGTGLVGESLYDIVDHAVGVDIAERMVEIAGEREVYDELYVAEIVNFLQEAETDDFDLIVAADVLPYLGRLDPLMEGVSARCAKGGLFAFSSETLDDDAFGERSFTVGPHQRFAHRLDYVAALLGKNDFDMKIAEPIVVRHELDQPVAGHLVIAVKR